MAGPGGQGRGSGGTRTITSPATIIGRTCPVKAFSLFYTRFPRHHRSQASIVAVGQPIDARLPVDVVIILPVDDIQGGVQSTFSHRDSSNSTCLVISHERDLLQGFLDRGEAIAADTVGGALGGQGADGAELLVTLLEGPETVPDLRQLLGPVPVGPAGLLGLGLAVGAIVGD